jgi:hypothetical protein
MRPALLGILLTGALATTAAAQDVMTLRGVVRDSAGAPVAEAEVMVGGRSVLTSAAGRFIVASVPTGAHLLVIRKVGYAPLRAQVIVTAALTAELEYQLDEEAARLPTVVVEAVRPGIYGTVGDTALRPVPGARVQVMGPRGGDVRTDSSGQFAFPQADRGQYMVRVTHPEFNERRLAVTLAGGGRELAFVLTPGRGIPTRLADQAVADLGRRLTLNSRWDRVGPDHLERRGSIPLCNMPPIQGMARGSGTLILDGVTVLRGVNLRTVLCAWRADEVDLVEFGTNVCRDLTGTLRDLAGQCPGRNVPRSIMSGGGRITGQGGGGAYVILWERR